MRRASGAVAFLFSAHICSPAWLRRRWARSRTDSLLAVSFVGETRFLAMEGEELAGADIPGFASNEQTVACGNVLNDQLVQVRSARTAAFWWPARTWALTPWPCRVAPPGADAGHGVGGPPRQRRHAHAATPVDAAGAAAYHRRGADAVAGPRGHGLGPPRLPPGRGQPARRAGVRPGVPAAPRRRRRANGPRCTVRPRRNRCRHATLEHEIACIDAQGTARGVTASTLCAVGLWTDMSVRLLELPSLKQLSKDVLGGGAAPGAWCVRKSAAAAPDAPYGLLGEFRGSAPQKRSRAPSSSRRFRTSCTSWSASVRVAAAAARSAPLPALSLIIISLRDRTCPGRCAV